MWRPSDLDGLDKNNHKRKVTTGFQKVLSVSKATTTAGAILPVIVVLYLFLGFYGPYFNYLTPGVPEWWPSAILGGAIYVCAWRSRVRIDRRNAVLIAFCALIIWAAIRVFPDFSAFGVKKIARTIAWGVPFLVGGIAIQQSVEARRLFCFLLTVCGVLGSIILVIASIDAPWRYNGIGAASYQFTGITLGLCMVAAVASKRWVSSAVIFLGVSITGNLTGPLFGPLAAAFVLLMHREWRGAAFAVLSAFVLVGTYTALVYPPMVVAKVVQKIDRGHQFEDRMDEMNAAMKEAMAAGQSITNRSGRGTLGDDTALNDQGQTVIIDRYELFEAAYRRFLEKPMFGGGYGNVNYVFAGYVYPHNSVLEVSAETGVVGLILITGLFYLMIAKPWAAKDELAVGVAVYVILASMVSQSFPSIWIMMAVGLSAWPRETQDQGVEQTSTISSDPTLDKRQGYVNP